MADYPMKFTEGQDPVEAYDRLCGKPGRDSVPFNPSSAEAPHKVSYKLNGGGGK